MYADAGLFLVPMLYGTRVPAAASAARLLESVARGTRKVSTSTLTWDEVVYVVRRLLGAEDSIAKGAGLLAFPNLTWLRVDMAVLRDRKSTRLNSSHTVNSYADFCVKKKI